MAYCRRISSVLKEGIHYKKHHFHRKCDTCHQVFDNPILLLTHMKCLRKTSFYQKRKDGSEIFNCMKCDSSFIRKDKFRYHIAYHHSEKIIECLQCSFKFSCISILKTHACYKKLRVDLSKPKEVISSKFKEGIHFKRHPFKKKCDQCHRIFADPVAFLSHKGCPSHNRYVTKISDNNFKCNWSGCGKYFPSRELWYTHFSVHAEKVLECLKCHSMSSTLCTFRRHKCDVKNQTDTISQSFKFKVGVHFKRLHFEKKCLTCSRTFTRPVSFLIHQKCLDRNGHFNKVTDGSRIIECPICLKLFQSQRTLRFHVSYHHAAKTIECLRCHRKFTSLVMFGKKSHHCWKLMKAINNSERNESTTEIEDSETEEEEHSPLNPQAEKVEENLFESCLSLCHKIEDLKSILSL